MNPLLNPIAIWLYGLMTVVAPPGRPQFEPAAMESVAQAQERYKGISETIAKVAFDPAEQPIAGTSRSYTAALLLSLSFHESGFRRDVDLGIGRMKLAKSGWNDHGRSWCMMQINLGTRQVPDTRPGHEGSWREESVAQTEEGWWGTELLEDREKCFRAGLHVIRRTWGCKGGTAADALGKYAGGTCYTAADEQTAKDAGDEKLVARIKATRFASANRVNRANRWLKTKPRDWKDTEIVKALLTPAAPEPDNSVSVSPSSPGAGTNSMTVLIQQ